MQITNPMIQFFNNRTKKHIELVNHYANKVGYSFPNHDGDKFSEQNKDSYTIMSWCCFRDIDIPEEDKAKIDNTINTHYKNNKHHPEHWSNLKEMDEEALTEMCADWCAMSKEYKTDPMNWADDHIGTRWDFSETQIYFIYKTLNKMWSGE